ncbi:MAG: thiamine phosphate synthase [Betaproteobacteria bacterium]|nr:thiamine phosphate synthase [Betaproteobacteria bacterium]
MMIFNEPLNFLPSPTCGRGSQDFTAAIMSHYHNPSCLLPDRMLVTHAWDEGIEKAVARIEYALAQGIRMILAREQALPMPKRLDFLRAVVEKAGQYDAMILISEAGDNCGGELSRLVGAHGIHLSGRAMNAMPNRPDFPCVGASCHNAEEIRTAERMGMDYVTLGPVLPTPSHPGHPGLGWDAFAALAMNAAIPIYAIGGQSLDTLAVARQHGAHGIACMRNI